jgi:hypothetical protein
VAATWRNHPGSGRNRQRQLGILGAVNSFTKKCSGFTRFLNRGHDRVISCDLRESRGLAIEVEPTIAHMRYVGGGIHYQGCRHRRAHLVSLLPVLLIHRLVGMLDGCGEQGRKTSGFICCELKEPDTYSARDCTASRLASCPCACPSMPSATMRRANGFGNVSGGAEGTIPWVTRSVSSFGLCLRLMPGSRWDPTYRASIGGSVCTP